MEKKEIIDNVSDVAGLAVGAAAGAGFRIFFIAVSFPVKNDWHLSYHRL